MYVVVILWPVVESFRFRTDVCTADPPPPPPGPGDFWLLGFPIPPDLRCIDTNPADFSHLAFLPLFSPSIKTEMISLSPPPTPFLLCCPLPPFPHLTWEQPSFFPCPTCSCQARLSTVGRLPLFHLSLSLTRLILPPFPRFHQFRTMPLIS